MICWLTNVFYCFKPSSFGMAFSRSHIMKFARTFERLICCLGYPPPFIPPTTFIPLRKFTEKKKYTPFIQLYRTFIYCTTSIQKSRTAVKFLATQLEHNNWILTSYTLVYPILPFYKDERNSVSLAVFLCTNTNEYPECWMGVIFVSMIVASFAEVDLFLYFATSSQMQRH